jgi:hypothetical protein
MQNLELHRGIPIGVRAPRETLPGVFESAVVTDAMRRGVFAALPDLVGAASLLGQMYKEQQQHRLVVTDGPGARPPLAFINGFMGGIHAMPTIEIPANGGKVPTLDRPFIPATKPQDLVAFLKGHENWPQNNEELLKGGVLLVTNTLNSGKTLVSMREAVELAVPGYMIPFDVLTAHLRGVIPLEPDKIMPEDIRAQRISEMKQKILPNGGEILAPEMTSWVDSAEHPALVAARGFDVPLERPKTTHILRRGFERNGIEEDNRGLLIPSGLEVLQHAGVAAGNVFRSKENATIEEMIRAAEVEVVRALPRVAGSPSSRSIVEAIYS